MKKLSNDQLDTIARIRLNGAEWIAESVKNNWLRGQSAYIDSRSTNARKGTMRGLKRGNKEATGEDI